jgi:hypothetical protein
MAVLADVLLMVGESNSNYTKNSVVEDRKMMCTQGLRDYD